jgi:hypothetical protein
MTIPAPPARHKLEACTGRFTHQLKRAQTYLDTVLPALKFENEDDENLQFCLQTMILMLHTFLEEHYKWLVSLGTLWSPDEVRRHLKVRYEKEATALEEMSVAALGRRAAREVESFKERGKKLKSLFDALFRFGPFADDWCASKIHDFVAVRTIITHQGGQANESNASSIQSPDVIVTSAVVQNAVFYKLRIPVGFTMEVLVALGRSVSAIHDQLTRHPRFML